MSLSSLASRLKKQTDTKFGPEDPEWVQFISDHKLYIREKSPVRFFTPLELIRYRYRPEDFFTANNGDITQTWIFMYVNDLHDSCEFNDTVKQLWMVSSDLIRELRAAYESTRQYQDALQAK